MKVSYRPERIARLLKEEIAKVVQRELRDPDIGFVTLTDVVITNDLKHADVYVTVYGGDEEKKKSIEALNKAQGFIRRIIAKELNLRTNPTVSFHLDESFEREEKIEKILKEIQRDDEGRKDNRRNK